MQYLQAVPRLFLSTLAIALLIAACGEPDGRVDGGTGGSVGPGTGGSGGSVPTTCTEDCGAIPTGACEISVCNDGSYPGEVGQCVTIPAADGTSCDDGLFCTTGDVCEAGVCQGAALDCGAGDVCSEMVCDEEVDACVARPINEGEACDDGLFCTTGDVCVAGSCQGQAPRDCGEATQCAAWACDETADECVQTPVHEGEACDDGLFCTVGETCQAGVCTGGAPNTCGMGNPGECRAIACDEPSQTCVTVAANEGVRCETGNLCELHGTCQSGVCKGTPKNCSAWDSPCTTGVCDPLDGQCHPEPGPAGVACGDDTGCSTGVCEADGNCRLTFAPDGEVCTYGAGVEGNCLAGSCFLSNPCTGGYITTFANCADSGWTLTGDWQCGQPSSGPMRALLGDNVIATNLGGNYSFNIAWGSHTATSPWIDLTEAVAPWVSFYAWHETEGGSFDGWNVKVSTNGTTWTLLTDVSPPYNTTVNGQAAWGGGPSGRFSELRANLAAYAGQQVKLRIDMRSDGVIVAPGIYVGAVIVGDGSSAPVLIAGTPQNASAGTPWFFEPQRVGGGANLAWEIVGGVNHGWIVMDRHTGLMAGFPGPNNAGKASLTIRAQDPAMSCLFGEHTIEFLVAPEPQYATSFELCGDWTVSGDWECGRPTTGPEAAFKGRNALATKLNGNYSHNQAWGASSVISPPIDLSDAVDPELRFQMWMETQANGDGWNVKVSNDGGLTWQVADALSPAYTHTLGGEPAWSGNFNAAAWHEVRVGLSAYAGQTVQLRFDFFSNDATTAAGVYVDELQVLDRSGDPLAILTTSLPDAGVGFFWEYALQRAGGSQNAVWSILGGTNHEWMAIDPQTGVLSGTPTTMGPGEITVRVEEPTEPWNFAEATLKFGIRSLAYMHDFENCGAWTVAGVWACGTPLVGPGAARSGANVLAVNLNSSSYPSGARFATSVATSPPVDLTTVQAATVGFWAWLDTESGWDGFNLKISTDGGSTWSDVTQVTPPYVALFGSCCGAEPGNAWTNTSNGWAFFTADVSAWAGNVVRFRFAFSSDDFSSTDIGVFIDDFEVEVY